MGGLAHKDGLDLLGKGAGLNNLGTDLQPYPGDYSQDITLGHRGIGPADEVRGSQGIEMGDVRMDEVGGIEEFPQLLAGRWDLNLINGVCGLTRGHMVRAWSDTADTGHNARQFFYRASLAEALKTPQLRDLEVGILNLAILVEEDFYLAMAFQASYRINGNSWHSRYNAS